MLAVWSKDGKGLYMMFVSLLLQLVVGFLVQVIQGHVLYDFLSVALSLSLA